MMEGVIASPEIFSAVCAGDFTAENHAGVSANRRTTCLSDHNNLVWDD